MPESAPQIVTEFNTFDSKRSWNAEYHRIRNLASVQHQSTQKVALRAENRERNRYRDVSPYDDYRIRLEVEPGENDYLNASPVEVPLAHRKYILSQGPLPNTSGHFWMMVWQQMTIGVIMLNNVIENGRTKCHKYYPDPHTWPGAEELSFDDVNFSVKYITSVNKKIYILRKLLLTNHNTGESREILQFHYTSWPDFDVPTTTDDFLRFLFDVRQSGILTSGGPPVIHCSAGIGRSGTFCLVDSALVMVEEKSSLDVIDVRKMLLEMRRYRCGLIQTASQLRFSYLAIIDGSEHVLNRHPLNEPEDELIEQESEEADSDDDLPPSKPAPPPPRDINLAPHRNGEQREGSPPPSKRRELQQPSGPAPPPPPRTSSLKENPPPVPISAENSVKPTAPTHVSVDQPTTNPTAQVPPEEPISSVPMRMAPDAPPRTSSLTKHASLDQQHPSDMSYDRQMSLPAEPRLKTEELEEDGYVNAQSGLRKRREKTKVEPSTVDDDWEEEEPISSVPDEEDDWNRWFIAGSLTLAVLVAGSLFYKYYWLTS